MLIFTFDVDWAPEGVIRDVVDLLDQYNARGTFFATHSSEVLKSIAAENRHEVGIHPNFNPLLMGETGHYQKTIDALMDTYPSAVGLRCHSLAHSCPILLYCKDKNIKYDSNIYIPYGRKIIVFEYFGLMRIPFNWEDDGHWISGKSFTDCGLDLDSEINIFSFHPVHIYLNTHNQALYESAKQFYQEPEQLLRHRNKKHPGTRDLFISLLDSCMKNGRAPYSLRDYYYSLGKIA